MQLSSTLYSNKKKHIIHHQMGCVPSCEMHVNVNGIDGTAEKGPLKQLPKLTREMSSYTSSDEPSCCGTVQSDDNTQLSERDGRKGCTKPTIRYEVRLTDLQRATFYSFSINTLIFWYRSMQNTIFFVVLK
mmetsp:Transcript_2986/g.3448  ORF Transcript_2986/g.3448 Transcript_2986/m.3448 type:complete len:131 (-) Transcript_2986:632-1024(-)